MTRCFLVNKIRKIITNATRAFGTSQKTINFVGMRQILSLGMGAGCTDK